MKRLYNQWLKAEKLVDAKYFIKPIMWKEWQ